MNDKKHKRYASLLVANIFKLSKNILYDLRVNGSYSE